MKKLSKIGSTVIIAGAAFASSASIVSADGGTNFGGCMSQIDPNIKPLIAPGTTNTGPLTITPNGVVIVPDAFPGAMACPHDN